MEHVEILQKEPCSAPDFGEFEIYTAGVIFCTMFSLPVTTEAREHKRWMQLFLEGRVSKPLLHLLWAKT